MAVDSSPSFPEGQRPITEPRPGQITRVGEIKRGNAYLFMGLNGKLSQSVTVLEAPHRSETNPGLGIGITIAISYSKEELKAMAVHPQTTMFLPLANIGIKEVRKRLYFQPGTSIWLADPKKLPEHS